MAHGEAVAPTERQDAVADKAALQTESKDLSDSQGLADTEEGNCDLPHPDDEAASRMDVDEQGEVCEDPEDQPKPQDTKKVQ